MFLLALIWSYVHIAVVLMVWGRNLLKTDLIFMLFCDSLTVLRRQCTTWMLSCLSLNVAMPWRRVPKRPNLHSRCTLKQWNSSSKGTRRENIDTFYSVKPGTNYCSLMIDDFYSSFDSGLFLYGHLLWYWATVLSRVQIHYEVKKLHGSGCYFSWQKARCALVRTLKDIGTDWWGE